MQLTPKAPQHTTPPTTTLETSQKRPRPSTLDVRTLKPIHYFVPKKSQAIQSIK